MEARVCVPVPDCCDMRGMLSFMILWLLSKKDMYGQEMAVELEKRRGERPSPGTLYPALKELEDKELIASRKEGRKKVYALTRTGRDGFECACGYFYQVFSDVFRDIEEGCCGQSNEV